MTPESVGLAQKLVLGKHSGRHAIRKRLSELGFELSDQDLNKAFVRFKALADKKKEVFDDDLVALVEDEVSTVPETYFLDYLQFTSGTATIPTAMVRLRKEEKVYQESGWGDGPVDAAYRAIDDITGITGKLKEYSIRAVTGGKDALGEVIVTLEADGCTVIGRGSSTDVIEASVRAYVNAINKVIHKRKRE
jgi:2-isopropylmalate synthase